MASANKRPSAPSLRRAGNTANKPVYSLYLRISCIEMEKSRCELEREAARQRVTATESRLAALEREKAGLLAAIQQPKPAGCEAWQEPSAGDSPPPAAAMRIRY